MPEFLQAFSSQLRSQRWDDHRCHHHGRITPSLHFISRLSFFAAWDVLFVDPANAALPAFAVSMTTRQAFELKGYDHVNRATHARKGSRWATACAARVVMMSAWALAPLLPWLALSVGCLIPAGHRLGGPSA